MTLENLSQIGMLDKALQRKELQLEDLRSRMTDISPKFSGMPGKPGASDRIGENMPRIVDLSRKIEVMKLEFDVQRAVLELQIRRIVDIRIRLIFLLRFVDLKSWAEIAFKLGGSNTMASTKQMCLRYIQGSSSREWSESEKSIAKTLF